MTEVSSGLPGEGSPGGVGATRLKDEVTRVADELARDGRFAAALVTRPHPLLVLVAREELHIVIAPGAVWDGGRELLEPFAPRFADARALLFLLGRPRDGADVAAAPAIAGILPADASPDELFIAVTRGFELLDAKRRADRRGESLSRFEYELGELVDIAHAMSTERDVSTLLGIILEKSRFVTRADAGSIYVVEDTGGVPSLRFKLSQNDSVEFDSREFVVPMSTRSIAGSAALEKRSINIDDVYHLPPGSPFSFDRSIDLKTRYRSKSMLTVPLVSQRGEVIGVIQLINKKKEAKKKLRSEADIDTLVVPFDARSEELLGMVASQAAASLETALLYEEIRSLFEGFVKASVEAIESRDPTTSGHSRRVASLTVNLARTLGKETAGPYKDVSFTREDLRELEYASLLHDFGKIGVREKVLIKANKLYDEELTLLRARFDYVARTIETEILSRKLRAIEGGAAEDDLELLDRELSQRRADLEGAWQAIQTANEPTVLAAGNFAKIEEIAKETYTDLRGEVQGLLGPRELVSLSVKRGSLTPAEFDEIRSHVSHTFKFLSQIPWGKAFRRVPLIAGAHHERLNGTGYPNRLHAEEIPLQSKIMSVADIFDALTASDRPYKKAVPLERALDILGYEVKDNHLDADLVRIFSAARVWEKSEPGPASRVWR